MKYSSDFSKEVIDYILKNEHMDSYTLSLKKSPFESVDIKVISRQIQGRKIARRKFPHFLGIDQYMYPKKESLEQASSESTALFKSGLVSGQSFVDLTGGMGIDSFFMGRKFDKATYVELNTELYEITRRNFRHLDFGWAKAVNSSCESFLESNTEKYDWAYVDPSRRIGGSRKTSIHNYEPNVSALQDKLFELADNILIKLSPMQDISECVETLDGVRQLWVLSVHNEVKELLIHLDKSFSEPVKITAIDLGNDSEEIVEGIFDQRHGDPEIGALKKYIYQPKAAIVKAELHNIYAKSCGHEKIHPNTQLYTHERLEEEYMGRIFKVISNVGSSPKIAHQVLPEKKANVISKNYPLRPEEILNKLKLKSGGKNYLLAFTDRDSKKRIVLCDRVK